MFDSDRKIAEARKRFLSVRARWRRGFVDDLTIADAALDLANAYKNRFRAWPLAPYGKLCRRKYTEYVGLAWLFADGKIGRSDHRH